MSNLKESKTDSAEMKALQEDVDNLTQAFEVFSEEILGLEKAYQSLKERLDHINNKLKMANRDLHQKVAELDATSFYLNSLLNNMSQGILFVRLSGVISTYNPRAEEIMEMPREKVLLAKFNANFSDDLFGFSMKAALASRKAPETVFVTFRDKKELEVSTKFDLMGEDSSKGLIILIRDITEMRRLQSVANRHYRMEELGEMAALIAHEIRNPLGGIEGFASLLHRDLQGSPEKQKMASCIIKGAQELNRLVTNVLHYARPIKLHFATTDLVQIVQNVLEIVRMDSSFSPNINYRLEESVSTLLAPVDEGLLKTAFLNLVVNAIQAMPAGGELIVKMDCENDMARIVVADTGSGIAEENLEKIFSPFFSTKEEGNGLGLSEVQKVIQAHGGHIQVKSKLGQGTAFTIKLPLVSR